MCDMRKKKTHILILDKDDPEREFEFEIEFMLSLTPAERYRMMSRLVRMGRRMKGKHDRKEAPALIART